MTPKSQAPPAPRSAVTSDRAEAAHANRGPAAAVFAGSLGALLGLSLLKFGNPVILDRLVEKPGAVAEFLFSPWPVVWGYLLLAVVMVLGVRVARFRTSVPGVILSLPLVWLGWQLLAAIGTVDTQLTQATLPHFAACVACFYLGVFSLRGGGASLAFWMPLIVSLACVLWMGFDQHFGGLEAVRRWVYEQPNWQQLAPDYLRRIQTNRIFATLFYPNALAGVILLLGPAVLVTVGRICARRSNIVRGVVVGWLVYAALACLYWSGSKSAWLIAVLVASLALLHRPLEPRVKRGLIVGLVVLALAGFAFRFSGYFQRGAPSAVARLDYWQAAGRTALAHPWLGTGPGTFAVPYRQLKRPEAEMTRLVHNDYLQQASDSGFVGALAYAAFLGGSLARLRRGCATDPLRFAVWLGLVGWACQSCVEFGLYIPALSWLPFALLGWLWSVEAGRPAEPPKAEGREPNEARSPKPE